MDDLHEDETRPRASNVLADPSFRTLLTGQGLFDIGLSMRLAAQSWIVFELTGSQLWVGAAAGVWAVPVLMFAIFTGVLADRLPRRRILAVSGTSVAVLVALTALITQIEVVQAWHYLVIAFGLGIAAAFSGPSFFALVTSLVPRAQLSRANGLVAFVGTSGEMVGPLLTGVIIAASGAGVVFWIVSAFYLVGALAM